MTPGEQRKKNGLALAAIRRESLTEHQFKSHLRRLFIRMLPKPKAADDFTKYATDKARRLGVVFK